MDWSKSLTRTIVYRIDDGRAEGSIEVFMNFLSVRGGQKLASGTRPPASDSFYVAQWGWAGQQSYLQIEPV
ncbi:hypothetical protein GCM10023115_24380 [Pontixanthobacter gangjinensis]